MPWGEVTRRDGSLDDCNLQIGSCFGKDISGAETTASSANNNNVTFSVCIKILEVARSHGTHDLTLANWVKAEAIPFASKFFQELALDIAASGFNVPSLYSICGRKAHGGCLRVRGRWWGHVDGSV